MANIPNVNGWQLFAHPLFLDQVEALMTDVEKIKHKDPKGYLKKNANKRLAAIVKLMLEVIPQDPTRPEYRRGATLGGKRKHWFRAKFFQQYRLFFRFKQEQKVIIYAWVNDKDTKRAYDSSHDAYRTFSQMLDHGHPPEDWDQLLNEAQDGIERMQAFTNKLSES